MLVLSRQHNEELLIGNDIVITVVDIRGNSVRIGVKAPREVPIHRREVFEAIERENQAKALALDDGLRLQGEALADVATDASIDRAPMAQRTPAKHPASPEQREKWALLCDRLGAKLDGHGQQELASDFLDIASFLRAAA